MVHVPYRGSGPALPDLLAGNVAWMFETFSTMMQHHKAGKLRILAFAHQKRAAIAPEIPTMIEAGVPGFEAYTFNLFLGPAGTPKNVVDTIDQATRKVMADPSTIKFLEDIAAVPTTGHHASAHRQVHRGRDGQVGAGDQGRRHQDRVVEPVACQRRVAGRLSDSPAAAAGCRATA